MWLVLIVATLGTAVQATTIELESPQPNQKYQSRVAVRFHLRHSPNRLLKVRITGFDQVHHFLFEPLANGAATVDKRTVVDDYFLCKPGNHAVELTVFAVDEPDKLLAQQRIAFTIDKPGKIDFSKVYLGTRDQQLIGLERRFAVLARRRSTDPVYQTALQTTADELHKQKVAYAVNILSNCHNVAQAHAQVMDERRTLACLQTAVQVYDRDLPGMVAHPLKGQIEWRHLTRGVPYCFDGMANLYARHAQLDKAVEWLQKGLDFCEGQRKGLTDPAERQLVLRDTARFHRRIADMYLLLADDMGAWRKWTDLAVTFDRQGRDMAAP